MLPTTHRLPLEARLLVATGFALWVVAALSAVWEVLALQPPDSPLHFGVLAGPIEQLCTFSFALGSSALVAALLWPTLYPEGGGRWLSGVLISGALLHVLLLAIAARSGLLAVQLLDPRSDARWLLYGRGLALALSLTAIVALLVRGLRR